MGFVVIPAGVAALAWRSKSIHLIDGAFKRIVDCSNNHLKALQYGFSVHVLHQSTLMAYAAGSMIG
jgi:hypothetical protein